MSRLDTDVTWVRALDGSEYMPGLVGLNNMKANDYANVVVQILARVNPIRCGVSQVVCVQDSMIEYTQTHAASFQA